LQIGLGFYLTQFVQCLLLGKSPLCIATLHSFMRRMGSLFGNNKTYYQKLSGFASNRNRYIS
jgi:hypothetical protein